MTARKTFCWPRKRKTHCHRGHPLSGDNIWLRERKDGYIEHRCKACHAMYDRARYQRNKPQVSP